LIGLRLGTAKKVSTRISTPGRTTMRKKATKASINDLLREANEVLEPEVLPPADGNCLGEEVDAALMRATVIVSENRLAPAGGAFGSLHRQFGEELAAELESQEALARATVRVVRKTTRLMKGGLEAALADLQTVTKKFEVEE
jgi:hypothetical protein